jgi:hypothetical protein
MIRRLPYPHSQEADDANAVTAFAAGVRRVLLFHKDFSGTPSLICEKEHRINDA